MHKREHKYLRIPNIGFKSTLFTTKSDTPSISHFTFLKHQRTCRIRKTSLNFIQNFYFPNAPIWIKVFCNDCITCQLNKPHQKQIAEKQDFKGQSLYFNHRISFDTKGPISPSSDGNSFIMVKLDAFTHYVALNPVPHWNA